MSWTCGVCNAENTDFNRQCSGCGARHAGTQTKRHDMAELATGGKAADAPASSFTAVGGLPAYLAGARFATKGQWTSGALYVRPEGIFLLSAEDDIATPEKASSRKVPPGDEPIALGRSQWIPLKCIARVTHNDVAGHKIHLAKGNVPIRFDSAGWSALGAACLHLKIEYTT